MSNETKIIIDTDASVAPEGYEFTGEYRIVKFNEFYLYGGEPRRLHASQFTSEYPHPILRKLEPKRWRAEDGEEYWFICPHGEPITDVDQYEDFDDEHWDFGNYFRTEEQAKRAASDVHDVLSEYQKELLQ